MRTRDRGEIVVEKEEERGQVIGYKGWRRSGGRDKPDSTVGQQGHQVVAPVHHLLHSVNRSSQRFLESHQPAMAVGCHEHPPTFASSYLPWPTNGKQEAARATQQHCCTHPPLVNRVCTHHHETTTTTTGDTPNLPWTATILFHRKYKLQQ